MSEAPIIAIRDSSSAFQGTRVLSQSHLTLRRQSVSVDENGKIAIASGGLQRHLHSALGPGTAAVLPVGQFYQSAVLSSLNRHAPS